MSDTKPEWVDPDADIVARLATTTDALAAIDSAECQEGYWDGRKAEPRPGLNRSASYVQGWWAGMSDGYHRKAHPVDSVIAKVVLEELRQAWPRDKN